MLRRVHWAPISLLGISVSAWSFFTGCQASDTGGFDPNVPIAAASGGAQSSNGGTNDSGGSSTTTSGAKDSKGGTSSSSAATSKADATGGSSDSAKGGSAKGGTSSKDTTKASTAKGGTSAGKSSTTKAGTTASKGGTSTKTTSEAEGGTAETTEDATTAAPTEQTCKTNLLEVASGTSANWITLSSGKSCSVAGSIYAYGDGTSITTPAVKSGDEYETPCTKAEGDTAAKCCLKGKTKTGADATYWGGGLGIDLNAPSSKKNPYDGTATGFKITIEGDFPTAAKLRIGYQTASAESQQSPFVESTATAKTYTVNFSDVECPDWEDVKCTDATDTPYALKIQLVGGGTEATAVGAFDFCVTSIMPIE